MSFNWFNLVVAFGILQGLVCGVLMSWRRPKNSSARLLAAMLFTFSLLSFKILLHTLNLWEQPLFRYFPLGIDLLIQPLLYLYICALTVPGFRLSNRTLLHLVPPALFMAHSLVVYTAVLTVKGPEAKDTVAEYWNYNAIKTTEDVLSVISSLVYGIWSLINVQRYRKWLELNISATNYQTFTWLRNLLIISGALAAGLALNLVLDATGGTFLHWKVFYVYLSVMIYYVGMRGLISSPAPADMPPVVLSLAPQSKFSDAELDESYAILLKALQDRRLYLDNELTLQSLAADVGLGPALVSVAINKRSGESFRGLINRFRVEDVKRKLPDPNYAHLSILGIALESGFNSEASFYRIFKASTGISPKVYLRDGKS